MSSKSRIDSIKIEQKKRNFLVEVVMKKSVKKRKNKKKEILNNLRE